MAHHVLLESIFEATCRNVPEAHDRAEVSEQVLTGIHHWCISRRNKPQHFLQTNIDGSVVSRRLVLGRLTQEIPASVGSSSKCALRRSTRLTKRDEGIIKLTEVETARGDEAAEESEDEQDGTSFRDQRAENADPEAGSNSVSDSEGSMPLHLSRESLGSGCTSVCFFFVPRRKLSNASG